MCFAAEQLLEIVVLRNYLANTEHEASTEVENCFLITHWGAFIHQYPIRSVWKFHIKLIQNNSQLKLQPENLKCLKPQTTGSLQQ